MGQQVKSAVSRRWGQGGGACFDTVELCQRFETGGTERISFWTAGRRGGGSWLPVRRPGFRMRLRWKGVCVCVCVCVCVNLGQQCLCLTCKQEQKVIPACTHFACREEAQTRGLTNISRTNCYGGSSHLCAPKAALKAQRSSLLDGKHFSEAIQRAEETFSTAEQLQCPEDIFS